MGSLVGKESAEALLTRDEIRDLMAEGIEGADLSGKKVLILIPDGTRSGPLPLLFRLFHELLTGRASQVDFLIALGTHQPLGEDAICKLLNISSAERADRFSSVGIFNHRWDRPDTFRTIGEFSPDEVAELSQGELSLRVPVTVNAKVFDYDHLIVCGPVFPHEVAGFSGGGKYFFPGIGGTELIDFTHWLGALITCFEIIGTKETPVRSAIDKAASMIDRPKTGFCHVVKDGGLAGLFIGELEESWSRAVDLSARLHVKTFERPFRRVLSVMPGMYEDIWTAAKGMYKLEPVVEDGGELIIYAPNIDEISYTHGSVIRRIGYHVRDYFTGQWDRFEKEPWGVLAHSTHLRGLGTFVDGVERSRIEVTLATGIPEEQCRQVCLGYRDPASIQPEQFADREDQGVLLVPHAGEILHRLKGQTR